MPRRTKAEAERTRLHILKTSLDLFLKKGYERTTFIDVAESIGLSKGAVYHHFKSKPELLAALMERMRERHEEALGGVARAGSLEGLRDDFVGRAERLAADAEARKFFKMMTQVDWSSRQARPLVARMTAHHRRMAAHTKALQAGFEQTLGELQRAGKIRMDADTGLAAAVLAAMWLGLLRAKADRGGRLDLPRAVGMGFDMAIAGMGV